MKRLLYVEGGGVASIRKDGASLLVQVDGQADRRYPFRLLTRVVLRGDTRIHAAAVWGLMEAGIPISLLSRQGLPVGFAIPYRHAEGSPQTDLECLLERFDGRHQFGDWCSAVERRELRRCVTRSAFPLNDLRPPAVEASLRRLSSPDAVALVDFWRQMTLATVWDSLAAAGFSPAYLSRMDRELDLSSRFTRLLLWRPWFEEFLHPGPVPALDMRAAWEFRRQSEARRAAHLVAAFVRWLKGVVWQATSDTHGW